MMPLSLRRLQLTLMHRLMFKPRRLPLRLLLRLLRLRGRLLASLLRLMRLVLVLVLVLVLLVLLALLALQAMVVLCVLLRPGVGVVAPQPRGVDVAHNPNTRGVFVAPPHRLWLQPPVQ